MKSFSDRVIEAVLTIPEGRVTTYGRLARACGGGAMVSQSITAILGKAVKEKGIDIPFHRIVYADGRVWIDAEHKEKRLKLYKKEGIELDIHNKIKNFAEVVFDFL